MKDVQSQLPVLSGSGGWLARVAESSHAGLFVCSDALLYANPSLCAMADTPAARLVGTLPDWLLPAESGGEVALGDHRAPSCYEIQLPAGRRAQVAVEEAGTDAGRFTIGLVTPIGTAESDELTTAGHWFEVLAQTTPVAIFAYRQTFIYASRGFEKLVGYSEAELLEMDAVEIVHPDYREAASRSRRQRLAGDPPTMSHETVLLTRDGRERWVEYTATRIEMDGEPAGLGAAFDVTDRKQAELALRASEERLSLAQQAAGIMTWDWNLLTDELVCSDYASTMLGLTDDDLPRSSSRLLEGFIHDEDRETVLEAARRAVSGDGDYWVEHRLVRPTGDEIWLLQQGRAIRDETGWVVRMVGVSRDITESKRTELALRQSEERLRLMVEQIPALLWATDRELRYTSCMGAGLADLGLRSEDLVGRSLADHFETDNPDFEPLWAHRQALEGRSEGYEQVWRGKSYQAHVEPLRGANGQIVGCIGIALDVTDRLRAERALSRERERASTTLASIGDGVIRTDADTIIDYMNPVAEGLTGVRLAQAVGRRLDEVYRVVDELSNKPLINPVERSLREQRPVILPGQRLLLSREGREFVIRDSAAPIRHDEGEIIGAVLVFKDVTVVREMELEMSYLASHDGLTGLINRTEFERHLGAALESSEENRKPFALLQLDVAQFKVVNDTCGHLAGDEMLKTVARLLRSQISSKDSLARLSGDEFGLLLPDCDAAQARRKAESIRSAFKDLRFVWHGRSFEVGICIGLVPAGAGDAVSSLMIAADTACLMAKESGRNRIHEYQPDDAALAARYGEMHWTHRIYKALEEENFRLYGQEIQPLGPVRGDRFLCEVLIRLLDEDGNLVLPKTFIPAAERYRLISSIDRWVLSQSLKMLAQGATVGGRRITDLAINLSGESLSDESFLEFAATQVSRSGVAPERLFFEITETAAIANLAGAMRFISELKERGVRFVLDDFGSGLSSFAYLKNLPVDYLKVAQEFVRDITEPGMQRTLVRSINQIGHELGLRTIAEGVETEALHQAVRELRLDYAQGYWIAKPQPIESA